MDYPPTDGGMYAHVNKKKFTSGGNESTSGYPDIIHQVVVVVSVFFHFICIRTGFLFYNLCVSYIHSIFITE